MTVVPLSASASASAKQLATDTGMNAETFMKLFTSQLANQNPMEPMDGADFLNQFSQITQVQTLTQLQQTMTDMKSALSSISQLTELGQAQGLLGKNIDYLTDLGTSGTGTVQSIRISPEGKAQLALTNGTLVALNAVRRMY